MKLSTKGRYGLRAAVDLAMHSGETVALSAIAERQKITVSYLEQIIPKLRKVGIVNSVRGAQGGYTLARPPEQISVGDVLRALEGNLSPVDCKELQDSNRCMGSDLCITKYVWTRISASINDTVDHMMLSELVAEGERLRREHGVDNGSHGANK